MGIRYSRHARERMILRGISQSLVEEALQRGSKEIQQPDKVLSRYRYFCVVYKKVNEITYIITIKPR